MLRRKENMDTPLHVVEVVPDIGVNSIFVVNLDKCQDVCNQRFEGGADLLVITVKDYEYLRSLEPTKPDEECSNGCSVAPISPEECGCEAG
jgi:hypothetical protein